MVGDGSGYPYDGTPDFQLPARGTVPPAIVESDYFIAKYGYLSTSNLQFYNDDRLNPYAFEDGEEFRWIRPGAFGGKSLIWGRWSFRWSPGDFEANKREGGAGDWPIRYDDVVQNGRASCRERGCKSG